MNQVGISSITVKNTSLMMHPSPSIGSILKIQYGSASDTKNDQGKSLFQSLFHEVGSQESYRQTFKKTPPGNPGKGELVSNRMDSTTRILMTDR